MIFARKINKIPQFYMIFARKCPNFTYKLPEKKFPDFFFLGGGRGRGHIPPIFYAYEKVRL